MENVDCTIELSIDIPPILSQKRVDLDDVLETSEDDEEPVMKTDSNVVYDMVMSERYVYEAPKNHDVDRMENLGNKFTHLYHENVISSLILTGLN